MKVEVPVRLLRDAEQALRRAAAKRTTSAGLRLKMRSLATRLSRRANRPSHRVWVEMKVLSKVVVVLARVALIIKPELATYLGS